MNESDAKKQIENMVRFIEQEAKEKAEEILDQTEQELEAWKNEFKHNERSKWKKHYQDERKRKEVQGKIAESKLKYSQDERVMKKRQDLLVHLKDEARATLTKTIRASGSASQYNQLLEDLLVEGLLKLMESKVTVRAVKADQSTVKGLLSKAKARFNKEMAAACTEYKTNFNMNIDVQMDNEPLPEKCIGGVWVMSAAYTNRPDAIILRNSLDARLDATTEAITPTIRGLMFPEDEERAKEIADSRAKALKAMLEEHH